MSACVGVPVSWLRLERYHLGEAGAAERAAVEAHLAECAACAACLARIEADGAVALPPLPVVRALPARRAWRRGASIAGSLALAAALVLAVAAPWRRATPVELASAVGIKGGDLAFTLVRDDDARVTGPAGTYRDGDRFKAVVTCPPAMAATFDLVVFDEAGRSFPLGPGQRLACGNDVPLAGAMRLTGRGEETVCLVWSAEGGAPDRGAMTAATLGAPGEGSERAACKRLTAAAP